MKDQKFQMGDFVQHIISGRSGRVSFVWKAGGTWMYDFGDMITIPESHVILKQKMDKVSAKKRLDYLNKEKEELLKYL